PISKRALTNSSRRRTWREPFARKLRRSLSISGPENERPMGSPPCSIPGLGAAPDWPSRYERRRCPRLRMSIGLAMKPSQPPSKACCWASAIVQHRIAQGTLDVGTFELTDGPQIYDDELFSKRGSRPTRNARPAVPRG